MAPASAAHPILIVDDEQDNLELLARFLRPRHALIYVANDGEEGLRVVETRRIDLILTDHRMPKLEGTELLRRAREIQPEAMRVLITGYGDVDTLTAAINFGHVYQIVPKPIDLRALDMIVQRALEAHEAARRERELFEAFVYASVTAIEQRDPSTAGHSFRVADMTTRLAAVVDGIGDGPLAGVRFSRDELEQIRYASLLHDFGKIGVREAVLVKSHKLPPARKELFELRVEGAVDHGRIDRDAAKRYLELMALLNDPSGNPRQLEAELRYLEDSGLLGSDDAHYLRIERGSLSEAERREIQSHVLGTISFLRQIPWPRRLGRVVEIAGAHHEFLNGTGYPSGMTEIPVEARMMTVCDIYDALVAADRPYKTAVSHEHALGVLRDLVKEGALDPLLVDLFAAREVHNAVTGARELASANA